MRFELTTSALPRRRSVHWSYRGSVPGAGLEPACADFKDRPGCQQPTPEWSRLPVPTRVSRLTGAGPQPCATAGHRRKRWRSLPLHGPEGDLRAYAGARCPRCDLNAQRTVPQTVASAIGLRGRGAAVRCRTGPSALRGRSRKPCAAASLPGKDSNLDSRGSEPRGLPN